jgi:hypothetical protein
MLNLSMKGVRVRRLASRAVTAVTVSALRARPVSQFSAASPASCPCPESSAPAGPAA